MTEVEQLRARVETLETALRFYADPKTYDSWDSRPIDGDTGAKAIAALAATAPSPTAGAVLPAGLGKQKDGSYKFGDGSAILRSAVGDWFAWGPPGTLLSVRFPLFAEALSYLLAAGYARDAKGGE